jgi:RNA polymerase sigma factor (sigma-70 family)
MNNILQYLRRAVISSNQLEMTDGELLDRFLTHRDDAAFATLVHRHGSMVWGVCRRVLAYEPDAEDAFQATFLVLIRKAASVRPREAVANWLYGVAHRIALNTRANLVRRRTRETQVTPMPEPAAREQELWRDLLPILDQELSSLPHKYRTAIVLCDLEGRTRKAVAKQLGIPEGTVSGRLTRGRAMLAKRLSRHGLGISGGALATMISQNVSSASVPMTAVSLTIKAARLLAAGGGAVTGVVSARVAAMTEGMIKTMLLKKLKLTVAMLLIGSGGIGLTAWAFQALAGEPRAPVQASRDTPRGRAESVQPSNANVHGKMGRLEGRFTAAESGKPVAGAKIRVLIQGLTGQGQVADAQSDADGRYVLELPFGDCQIWGVSTPAGYYMQDPRTYGSIATSSSERRVVRDFVLHAGSPWRVELDGATAPPGKPIHFSAWPHPERESWAPAEILNTTSDARGKAVLTLPLAGGRYRFTCGFPVFPNPYEIPPVNLEIDKDFDPRQVRGAPETVNDRKAVRLRDAVGRAALVEGAKVVVEAGQVVLRFEARPIPAANAIILRGAAVDEDGKAMAGAKFIAAFASGGAASMSQLEALTDAQGKFELRDVRPQESLFAPESYITMIAVKSGFAGARSKELNLLEIKQAGSGDFDTVVLKPGHTLRGKVVDENGRPLHGAVVTNNTDYFVYAHLRCRTDAEGRFIMPDLPFGSHKISAQYGERYGQEELFLGTKSKEYVITVRHAPTR